MVPWRWIVEAPAADETDGAIVADVLEAAIRDERNDPHEPVRVRHFPAPARDRDLLRLADGVDHGYRLVDATPAQVAGELDVVLEGMLDGAIDCTPRTRELVAAELELRRVRREGPAPSDATVPASPEVMREVERLERQLAARALVSRGVAASELLGIGIALVLLVALLASVVVGAWWLLRQLVEMVAS